MNLPADLPLKFGSPAEFASVRDFFRQINFSDAMLCRVLGMDDMSDLGKVAWDKFNLGSSVPSTTTSAPLALLPGTETEPQAPAPAAASTASRPAISAELAWALRVFVRGEIVPEPECRAACGNEAFAAFVALGLLRPAVGRPGILCPVWVYPADGFVCVSDRRDDPEGRPFTPPADVVFPGIYAGTLRFLKLLPEPAGGDALDLCGGSGIGALRLARTAKSAATADITRRSAVFADFNAQLNGIKMASLCGDLYAPADGEQFDLISAHPPFVPATGPNMVYRDAGDTGEEVTRRIIEGLPAYLRIGGTCVILCVARDTTDQAFELRARDWLAPAADNFDLVFGLEKILEVEGVVESMRKRSQQMSDAEARALLDRLRSLGTRQFVYGALFIRRFNVPVQQAPLRVRMTTSATAADFDRVLAWRHQRRQPGFADWLARARPRLAPKLELAARHLVQDGGLVPADFVFSIRNGFEAAMRPDAWLVPLIARLEGSRSVAEVFDQAKTADELPAGFALNDFARLVQDMVERGFLHIDASAWSVSEDIRKR